MKADKKIDTIDLITKHFHKLPSYIRFLITTRTEKDMIHKFQSLNPIFLVPNEERNLHDLCVFFENKLKIKTKTFVKNLVARSEGLMLYASFIAKIFEDNFVILSTESLPKGIEEIYESYFKRLENELKIFGIDEDKFLKLLSVIAVAKQPLPSSFIEKILCPEKDSLSAQRMLKKLISCVSSLLVVKDECISIFHKSIRDWLVKPDHSFTIIKKYGHKTLADICVNQMQTLKKNEVRFTYDLTIYYALQFGVPHILEAQIEDKHALAKLIETVIDLEIVYSSLCVDVTATLNNFVELTTWYMYNSLSEGMRVTIKTLIWILREYSNALNDTPQSFLSHVANEKIKELSTKASTLLMTRYKDLTYFESEDVEQAALIDRILTEQKVVEVDISPSEDFVICGYEEKGIELFRLSNMKPIWKIDDIVVKRKVFPGIRSYNIVSRCTVFHPFLNIIFPGQLDPVLNLEGKYQSGPITREDVPTKFTFCCFSHDHNKMVTNNDNHLIVWDLRYNEKVRTLECDLLVMSILFSGNDRYIGTATYSSFQVYDTEQWYRLVSWRCDYNGHVVFSTFKLDSWYCWRADKDSGSIVRYDQTSDKPVNIDFFLWPRNARAMVEFQAIMENGFKS